MFLPRTCGMGPKAGSSSDVIGKPASSADENNEPEDRSETSAQAREHWTRGRCLESRADQSLEPRARAKLEQKTELRRPLGLRRRCGGTGVEFPDMASSPLRMMARRRQNVASRCRATVADRGHLDAGRSARPTARTACGAAQRSSCCGRCRAEPWRCERDVLPLRRKGI